jgi:hypothetical protein
MPIEIYKLLGQVEPAANTETVLYTAPANATVEIKTFTLNHNGSGNTTAWLSVSKDGAATTGKDYIYFNYAISANSTKIDSNINLTLAAGDVIRVKGADNDISFQVHGVEIYTPAYGAYFDVYENGVISTIRLYGLETNLNYLKYSDEDENLYIGFRGYGPTNEIRVPFPSAEDRLVFVQSLEQARIYGNYGNFDPVVPMVSIGNNIAYSGTTSTTTSAPATTTTTTVAGTTTTSTSTTSTTTAAPDPVIYWNFNQYPSASDAQFEISVNGSIEVLAESASQDGPISVASLYEIDYVAVYCSNTSLSQIQVWDVTNETDKYSQPAAAPLYVVPSSILYGGAQYQQGSSDLQPFTLDPSKEYLIYAEVY